MTQITIPALVLNGHLHHEIPLPELEGQSVLATLTVSPRAGNFLSPVVVAGDVVDTLEMRPAPEFEWTKSAFRARRAVEEFSRGNHADS
jgi:hypothetical protein